MSAIFSNLCNEISLASGSTSPYDIPRKPLSSLLNNMTRHVVTCSKSEKDDETIIYGLQILLLSDVERVRAASIRALRYSIHRMYIYEKFLDYRLDYLICRSLAIDLRNARERLEAYKFIRRFIHLYPLKIPPSFIYILDSIVSSRYLTSLTRPINTNLVKKPDLMINSCLELLCEIALCNPYILQKCHTINTMLQFLVDYEHDELIESVIYALLHAVDRFTINDNSEPTIIDSLDPNGPNLILVDEGMRQRYELITNIFSKLLAVFSLCEQGNSKIIDRRGMTPVTYDKLAIKEFDRVRKLKSCAIALSTILHSWIGFTVFCQPGNSSIRLLVNCLMVQSEPLKMIILDLFYDLLNVDPPANYDTYESALKSTYQLWNLTTGEDVYTYVAYEGAAKLPRLSSTRPNLLDSHMALMLLTFIDAAFIEAITEIASSDNSILRIRATLLLAKFLWLCNAHLPEEQSFLLMPLLMDIAIADDDSVKRRNHVKYQRIFEFKQRTSRTYSFQLAQLIYHAQHLNDYNITPLTLPSETLKKKFGGGGSDDPLAAERIDNCIRDTNTLQSDNYKKWNWDLILALLKDFPKLAKQIQGDLYERFLDKVYDFFKPEQKNGFNSIQLTDPLSNVTCRCLIAFADLLVYPLRSSSNQIKYISSNIVRTFLTTINDAFKKTILASKEGTSKAIITEQDLLTKNSVYYYLFLGRLSKTAIGTEALVDSQIFIRLSEMLKMDDDFVTSIIVALSSFNYYYDGHCRNFLLQALKSSCTALRLYSTSLLRVILRCNPIAFGHWGLSILCSQLHDKNQSVLVETVSILDEALEDKRLVHMFYEQYDGFSSIKNKDSYLTNVYHLASARLSSIPFVQIQYDDKHLSRIRQELYYWDSIFNSQYVIHMETRLFSAYSGGPLLANDYLERRKTNSSSGIKSKRKRISVHVSIHIYRQLCLHDDGFALLRSESRLENYATELKQHSTNCVNLNEVQSIKEALWALAHTASTENGYTWFIERDLLADFLRFAEECQNLSVRGTAFYGLSLIAQTPDGAMSLKDFGWETYRVRAHSIASSTANTDTYQCAERRMSRLSPLVLTPTKSPSPTPFDNTSKRESNDLGITTTIADIVPEKNPRKELRLPELKAKRSLTMPTTILLNSNEIPEFRPTSIDKEIVPSTPTKPGITVSFRSSPEPPDTPSAMSIPNQRSSSISKELINLSVVRDSSIIGGTSPSYGDIESNRSPSYSAFSYNSPTSSATIQSTSESLPLERFRPRAKAAHQSNALRQSKQLQKVPEVIQALAAPTTHKRASEPSPTDELYRSRLLRCNFLLKPDAAGYEYARRVQEISHATYSHINNNNTYDDTNEKKTISGKKDEFLSLLSPYTTKLYKKIYQPHTINGQRIDKFTTNEGKFSLELRDFDDADHDENTIYRGLAVPVDIRQVTEISDGYNLNYETWSDLVRLRSRTNTTGDFLRTRSATNTSTSSGEFVPMLSPTATSSGQEQLFPTNQNLSTSNICMMCRNSSNGTAHEDAKLTTQADFIDIKALASRLTVGIHTDEVEKKLLSWKESRPQLFDNICLYSEICYLLTSSSVRINAQRFLHELFSDCHFEKFRQRRRQVDTLQEEEDEDSATSVYF